MHSKMEKVRTLPRVKTSSKVAAATELGFEANLADSQADGHQLNSERKAT